MGAFLFRCPNTGLPVQAWSEEAAPSDNLYVPVSCPVPVCRRHHLVNPNNGRVLGGDDGVKEYLRSAVTVAEMIEVGQFVGALLIRPWLTRLHRSS
jgi:hypothetical protein